MKQNNENKYPQNYFEHWLAMYDSHQADWTKESIEQQIRLYRSMEGKDGYMKLTEELKQIIENNDLEIFLNDLKKGTKRADLESMAIVMLSAK